MTDPVVTPGTAIVRGTNGRETLAHAGFLEAVTDVAW
jgi:hypothetical protein